MSENRSNKRDLTWKEFERVELRVGTIVDVLDFPEARKPAYKMQIDFGEHGFRWSSAQITDLYSKEELINRQILAVTNFPTKQIANFLSECLVTGIVDGNEPVVLIEPDRRVRNGLRVG